MQAEGANYMANTVKHRNILSFRIARELIKRGFPAVDFATSHKHAGKVVIKFEDTEELRTALGVLFTDQ